MKSSEIRQSFLKFFEGKGHKIVRSAPVAPLDDPTLLFTNAGMNQFKDVFLNTGTRPYTRATDTQKCIRVSGKHNDLEEVGFDTYHHTLFEMLGNWSFGDYYKKEAIAWAWELLTDVWKLPKEKLYATVFREDDEAEALWKEVTDIAPERIMRFDEKDNFWEMGATGPCGPCSEIHIDLGEGNCDKPHEPGHVCGVNAGCARYIELWNLVFIQYNRDDAGELHPLPSRHVDTGMGFERVVSVLQGVSSNYQTDLFTPILDRLAEMTGKSYADAALLPAFRVVADHVRALTFAITDGVIPSNEGRGYVIRRILRRAARYGRNLGMHQPFLYKLVETVASVMGEAYPELNERIEHTTHVIKAEEERFNDVLDRGIEIFETVAADTQKAGKTVIDGEDVFRLYDTYGFPVDLTGLMAREKGLSLDEAGFEKALDAQRQRARDAGKFVSDDSGDFEEMTAGDHSEFIGYDRFESDAEIRQFRVDGEKVTLILDRTPFYGESGGQVGDRGEISGEGFKISIEDTQKQGDRVLHIGRFVQGSQISNPKVNARVEEGVRMATARHHTATHLLHKALKEVLGDHVNQAGSLVAPDRLRFDFTHFEALTPEQIDDIEKRVNRRGRIDHEVSAFHSSLEDAKSQGAMALFGEKYGDRVRVIQIDDYSMELCGGTHLERTGQMGYFRILKEEGIAAGVRRIEAVTGEGADDLVRQEKNRLLNLEALLKCRPDELETRVRHLMDERKSLEKQLRESRQESAVSEVSRLLAVSKEVEGVRLVAAKVEVASVDELRQMGDGLREQLKSGLGVLGTEIGGKVNFICVVTDDLIKERGIKAGDIVRQVAELADGRGGGKPHLALAGAKDVSKLEYALGSVIDILQKTLK